METSLLGLQVPDFEIASTGNTSFRLSGCRGSPLVIYFYPKDNTPGCTTEGQQFRDLFAEFRKLDCAVVGVSRDSLKSHEGFKAKMSFPFELLSDADEKACNLFGVIKMKNMYGKQVRGIERSTFVIDGQGMVRAQWRGVKVPGHAQEVLEFAKSL
ncbi:MAG: peroxiredoxin [Burkholderiales bacterium]